MALVGARLGPAAAETVTGAVVNVRPKNDKLAVWVGRGGGGREVGAEVERVLGAGGRGSTTRPYQGMWQTRVGLVAARTPGGAPWTPPTPAGVAQLRRQRTTRSA